MISDILKDILVDPVTKDSLSFDSGNIKNQSSGHTYNIIESVPELLPILAEEIKDNSDVHDKFGSEFNYMDHYQKDAEYFDYFKEFESGASKHENIRTQEQIVRMIPKDAELILDVGCGRAWLAERVTKQGRDVISMDISRDNPIKAIQKINNKKHHAVIADVYHLPFKKDSIDCIVASEIIEHVSNPKEFISKLLEVLKPEGKLIISTPFNERLEYYLCVHCNKPTPKNAHLHSFNKENIYNHLPDNADLKGMITLNNKYLLKLRTHIILKYFPFALWRTIDQTANMLKNVSKSLVLEIEKN